MSMNPASNSARDFAVRLNNLEDEKAQKGEDIKELRKEAAGVGLDDKALAKAVKLLRMDQNKRREDQEQLDLMLEACRGLDFSE